MKKVFMSFAAGAVLLGAFATSASAEEYKVKEGDTLSEIGQEYGVSVDNLMSWNNLTSDLIIVDETLDIENSEPSDNGVGNAKQATQADQEGPEKQQPAEEENASDEATEQDTADQHDDKAVETEAPAKEEQPKEEPVDNNNQETEANEPSDEEQQANIQEEDNADERKTIQEESSDEASGETMTMSSTAYTADCDGCSGTTADGTDLNGDEKVIAVDPDKIPLGSKVHVEGYGDAVAADTGGAINGNKIDLHMGDKNEAKAWGNKEVKVTVK